MRFTPLVPVAFEATRMLSRPSHRETTRACLDHYHSTDKTTSATRNPPRPHPFAVSVARGSLQKVRTNGMRGKPFVRKRSGGESCAYGHCSYVAYERPRELWRLSYTTTHGCGVSFPAARTFLFVRPLDPIAELPPRWGDLEDGLFSIAEPCTV